MRRLVLAVCLVSSTTGCAAVFKGGHQDVRFSGAPQGATVRVVGKYVGDLPTSASLDRDKPPNIQITSSGFQKQGVYLQKKADTPWFFWDIATCVVPVTLCIPVLVDAISGAWYSYDDDVRVKLEPETLPPAALKPSPGAPAQPGVSAPSQGHDKSAAAEPGGREP